MMRPEGKMEIAVAEKGRTFFLPLLNLRRIPHSSVTAK